jgi:hypothetical protein
MDKVQRPSNTNCNTLPMSESFRAVYCYISANTDNRKNKCVSDTTSAFERNHRDTKFDINVTLPVIYRILCRILQPL